MMADRRLLGALATALSAASAHGVARAQEAPNLAPDAVWNATDGASALSRRIDAILARAELRGAEWGLDVRDAATGRALYQRNAERLFAPASNLKLVVTAAAAHLLTPDYRYRTTLYATGPVVDGIVRGDLVLYGRGDPLISDRSGRGRAWEEMADSLLAMGIHGVTGGVVADESYFEAEHVRPDWDRRDLQWWYAAPVAALAFNENAVQVKIEPASPGARAHVSWLPESDFVTVENRTVTVGAGRAPTASLAFLPGKMRLRAAGDVPAGGGADVEFVAVPDPAAYAGTTFRETLERKGITFGRSAVKVVTDSLRSPARGATPLATHVSDPLARVIAPILLDSHNWMAETLLKTLGREVGGAGSWDAGLQVERDFLSRVVGIDPTEFDLRDGSGLSPLNRVTPRALMQLLQYVRGAPGMDVVLENFPVAGREGSLRTRLPDLSGRVYAKTGYIPTVDSLTGWLTTDDGRTVLFSIIANHRGSSAQMKDGIDEVVRALASMPGY